MHIAVDALFRLKAGGGATYLRSIVGAWRASLLETGDRLTILTTPDGLTALDDLRGQGVTFHVFDWPGRSVARRVLWEQIRLPQVLAKLAPDLLFCPGNMAPLLTRVPTVLVMQAPYCPDAAASFTNRRRLASLLTRLSARRAAHVIGISAVMSDLARRFGVNPARISTIPHGYDPLPLPNATEPPYPFPYLLYISAIRRYKCMAELIDGYAQMYRDPDQPDRSDSDWRLIIAGLADDPVYAAELSAQVQRLGLSDRVIFTGAIPRSEIDHLLSGALAMVYNSSCESFALPLLEAMSANVPVACSTDPAMLAVVGDAALTFAARSPTEIAAALRQMRAPSLRAELVVRGQRRLSQFKRWAEAAQDTREVLRNAIPNKALD